MREHMGELHEIGLKHGTDKAWRHNYMDFYEEHLPDRSFGGRLLEIGTFEGASLKTWREFYPLADIVGIDVLADLPEVPGATVHRVSQTDTAALSTLGMFDIIIDDGSHDTLHQQVSFTWLYNTQLRESGLYVMEDLHTSYDERHRNSVYTTVDFLLGYDRIDFGVEGSLTSIIPGGQRH